MVDGVVGDAGKDRGHEHLEHDPRHVHAEPSVVGEHGVENAATGDGTGRMRGDMGR